VGLPEGRDGVVVRVLVRRDDAVGDLLVRRALELGHRRLPRAVGVEEELHQERGVVRGLSPSVPRLFGREDRGEIPWLIYHLTDKGGGVVLRDAVAEGGRQQEQLVRGVRFEGFHSQTIPHAYTSVRTK